MINGPILFVELHLKTPPPPGSGSTGNHFSRGLRRLKSKSKKKQRPCVFKQAPAQILKSSGQFTMLAPQNQKKRSYLSI